MKYIFYFSLLLFALSSCKSNSLMKQRYTHYSNKPAKKEINAPLTRHQKDKAPVTAKVGAIDNTMINEQTIIIESEPAMYASNDAKPGIAQRRITALPSNKITTQNHEGFGVKKYGTQLKNSFQKKTETNRGPISAILRLVLSIILFVILVTLIVILILLVL